MLTTALTLDEAVRLGYALVDSEAARTGVRALAIKGPVLGQQGLRDERGSVDVDVLVDPRGFETLRRRLMTLGWVDVEPHDLPTVMPRHSSTFRHDIWPCEVDLHHYFPGFLATPDDVFDALWASRTEAAIAGRGVACPSREAHALVAALHILRDAGRPGSRERLSALVARLDTWPEESRRALVELGVATGSEQTLVSFYDALGLRVPAGTPRRGLDDWRLRSESQTTAALAWWVDLKRVPWRQKPARLRQAVWPSVEDMNRFVGLDLPEGPELRRLRLERLRRGLRQLPRAIRESGGRSSRRTGGPA